MPENLDSRYVVCLGGAGDSLAAGIIYGLCRELDLMTSLHCGLKAAALTVQSVKTVSDEIRVRNLEQF